MIILGIDPGWDRCGWARIKVDGRTPEILDCGLVTTSRDKTKSERLEELFKKISQLMKRTPLADEIAIEEIHLPPQGVRISNLLKLGEARGVLLLAASQAKVPIREVHPLVVKSTITGSANSSKLDVMRFLKFLLKDQEIQGTDDTSDAVAIALTASLQSRNQEKWVKVAG